MSDDTITSRSPAARALVREFVKDT